MSDNSYTDWLAMSNVALAQTIGNFIKHHRLEQNKTQDEVAKAAGISRSTLSLLERGEAVTIPTLLQVLRELNLLYVMDAFKVEQKISPIELAKLEQQQRMRARNKKDNDPPKSDW
jgi:transcriptional regulator with XRE-family HTH domain